MEVFTSSHAVFVCRRDGTQRTRNFELSVSQVLFELKAPPSSTKLHCVAKIVFGEVMSRAYDASPFFIDPQCLKLIPDRCWFSQARPLARAGGYSSCFLGVGVRGRGYQLCLHWRLHLPSKCPGLRAEK